jgi:tetratricopeptide (TPR) repeat protein
MGRSPLQSQQMLRRTHRVRQKAETLWKKPLLRHYTFHGIDHSERVITLLERLVDVAECTLTADEAYVLVSAALLHDVGMQDERFYERECIRARYTKEEIREAQVSDSVRDRVIRESHHLIAEERIKQPTIAGVMESELLGYVALVTRAHTGPGVDSCVDTTKGGQPMRLRLLAALLRLADELDCDFRRVDLDELDQCVLNAESKAHWWKCHCVDSVDIESDGRIELAFRFSQDELDEVTRILPTLVIEGLRHKLESAAVVRVLWPHLSVWIVERPSRVERDVGKRRMPSEVVEVFRQELDQLTLRRAIDWFQPLASSVTGTVTIALGEVPENLLRQAYELEQAGRSDEAILLLRKASARHPHSSPLWAKLADLLVVSEQWDEASSAAQEALNLEGGNVLAHLVLGIVLVHSGHHAAALEHLRLVEFASHLADQGPTHNRRLNLSIAGCLAGLSDPHYALERLDAASQATAPIEVHCDPWLERRATEIVQTAQTMRAVESKASSQSVSMAQVLGDWTTEEPYIYTRHRPYVLQEGITLGGSSDWIDFDFECEFQLHNEAAGFLVRADAWGTTGILMQLTPTMLRVHQLRHSDYFAGPLIDVDLPAAIQLREWCTVRFEARGNKLMAWIDEKPIERPIEVLRLYRSGKVGFRLWGREFALYKNPRLTVTKTWVPEQD